MDSSCESIKKSMKDSLYGWELSWIYNCKKKLNYYKVVQKVLQSGAAFCYYIVEQLLLQTGTGCFITR